MCRKIDTGRTTVRNGQPLVFRLQVTTNSIGKYNNNYGNMHEYIVHVILYTMNVDYAGANLESNLGQLVWVNSRGPTLPSYRFLKKRDKQLRALIWISMYKYYNIGKYNVIIPHVQS